MIVERPDLYDFTVMFTEPEFSLITNIVDKTEFSIEAVIAMAMSRGLTDFNFEINGKG